MNRVGNWELELKRQRYSLLNSFYDITSKWNFDQSPTICDRSPQLGTRFGNCAETYSFLHMLGYELIKHHTWLLSF